MEGAVEKYACNLCYFAQIKDGMLLNNKHFRPKNLYGWKTSGYYQFEKTLPVSSRQKLKAKFRNPMQQEQLR